MLKIILKNKSCIEENLGELDESRKDDARNFVNKISSEDTAKKQKYTKALDIMLADPIADNKYILWMLKHLEEVPDVNTLISAVNKYNTILKNIEDGSPLKDINNIKSFQDLTDIVDDYSKSIKELEREGQKIIVSRDETGGRFEVVRPLNVYASCQIGRNSRWCIAATRSQNYYRKYSKGGIVFYTIIDFSKPPKDKDSMFIYAISKQKPDQPEIYNAVDTKVERGQVSYLIGIENEKNLYQKMVDEAGLDIESTTSEKHSTFFTRFMKLINTLPKYDKTNVVLSSEEDAKYIDMENEVGEYLEDWQEKYENKSLPSDQRKHALRHMVLFAKKASNIDNVLARYRIGQKIKYDFVGEIPQLYGPMVELLRDPNWIKSAEGNFKQMSADFKEKDRFDLEHDSFFSNLFSYCEQAIHNGAPKYLDKFFDEIQSERKGLDPNDILDQEKIHKINDAEESVTKAAVFNDHPSALKFLYSIIANNSYSLGIVRQVMNTTYGIAREPDRTKKYADDILEFIIDKYKSSERYGAKLEDLYSVILKIKNLSQSKYQEALKQSHSYDDGVGFVYNNDINLLDPEYQEKVANMVEKVFERGASGTAAHSLANAMYGVCLSLSLPKKKISSILEALFNPAYNLYRNVPGVYKDNLIEKFGDDEEINSPNFRKFIEIRKGMSESRMFRYDNERKIYRIFV